MNTVMNILLKVLRKLNRTRLSFSDGSYIEYYDREAIRYVEPNGRKMEITWYFQYWFKKGRILYPSDINSWDPPFEKEIIPQQKKTEIQNKIVEYCQKKRIPLEFREKP
jgi:16S rRNA G966 N2-methylase RsmD